MNYLKRVAHKNSTLFQQFTIAGSSIFSLANILTADSLAFGIDRSTPTAENPKIRLFRGSLNLPGWQGVANQFQ
jgi:hypothetical protein